MVELERNRKTKACRFLQRDSSIINSVFLSIDSKSNEKCKKAAASAETEKLDVAWFSFLLLLLQSHFCPANFCVSFFFPVF